MPAVNASNNAIGTPRLIPFSRASLIIFSSVSTRYSASDVFIFSACEVMTSSIVVAYSIKKLVVPAAVATANGPIGIDAAVTAKPGAPTPIDSKITSLTAAGLRMIAEKPSLKFVASPIS